MMELKFKPKSVLVQTTPPLVTLPSWLTYLAIEPIWQRVRKLAILVNVVLRVPIKEEEGNTIAEVPNIFLKGFGNITVRCEGFDEHGHEAEEKKNFYIAKGEMPADYEYVETETLKLGGGGSGGGASVQADWNQNDSSAPDYVKGRTHYVIPEGTYHVEEQTVTIGDELYCELVGRCDLAEGCEYEVTFNGETGWLIAKYSKSWNCVYLGNPVLVDDGEDDGIPFAIDAHPDDGGEIYLDVKEPGEYTIEICSVQDGYKKIDPRFIIGNSGGGGGEEYDLDVYKDDNNQWVMEKGDFDSLYAKLSNAEFVNCRMRNAYTNHCYTNIVVDIHYDGDDDEIEIKALSHQGRASYYINRNNEFVGGLYEQFQFRT